MAISSAMGRARACGPLPLVLPLLLLPALGGCEKKADKTAAEQEEKGADAGPPLPPGVDPNIARAVEAVAREQAAPAGPGAAGGPPPGGVFPPGKADAEAPRGAAPKLNLAERGAEPRLVLASFRPSAEAALDMEVEVAVRMGPRSAMPTLAFHLAVTAKAPTAAAGGKPAAAGASDTSMPSAAAAASSAPEGLAVVAKVVEVGLGAEQPGQLPPELAKQIRTLKGSEIRYTLGADGALQGYTVEMAKQAPRGMTELLDPLRQPLLLLALPQPTEALGQGAVWMVSRREFFADLDVVAYRMVKVERLSASAATLTIQTRRYAAQNKLDLPQVPPNQLTEVQAEGRGQLELGLAAGATTLSGVLADSLVAALTPLGGQGPAGQVMRVQLEVQTRFSVKRAAAGKKPH